MAAVTKLPLLEELQLEFPSLDSSLIAAFLSERDFESLTKRQLRKLRRTLAKLATGPDHDQQLISETPSGTYIDGRSSSSGTFDTSHESSSAPSTVTDATSPLASSRSDSICTTSSPSLFGFLQAVFPEIPPTQLERVITDVSCDEGFADGVDVERIIQLLLTEEYPGDPGEDGGTFGTLENTLPPVSRGEVRVANAKGKKRKKKLKTVALFDIRQQQHVDEGASESRHGARYALPSKSSDVDVWTSVSSISSQLATLLHPHSESFFKSYFHSPESKTPAMAVRNALTAITRSRDDDVSSPDMTVLLNLHDILRSTSEYTELSEEEQKRLFLDARLCLQAVGSRTDDALDLVWLLRSLDADDVAGWKIAPCHQEPLPFQDNFIPETSKNKLFSTSAAQPWPRLPSQTQDDWNVVTNRKRRTAANRHSISIPASNHMHVASTHQIGFARGMDPGRLEERRDDLQTRIREASVSAARAWKGGNSKNMGRQVATYYVEEARRLQEELKDAAMDVARARVNATKKATASGTVIDLHYTTAAQAVALAKECLRDHGASNTCPMEFITGRGNHSAGGKAVLGPAVYGALTEDGWIASTLPAGLIVHGQHHD